MVLTPAKDSIDVGLLVEDIKKSLAFYQNETRFISGR